MYKPPPVPHTKVDRPHSAVVFFIAVAFALLIVFTSEVRSAISQALKWARGKTGAPGAQTTKRSIGTRASVFFSGGKTDNKKRDASREYLTGIVD